MVGVGRVVDDAVDHDAQGVEQGDDGRLPHERHLVARDLHRDPGCREGSPQRRDRGPPGADQDGHVAPRHLVLEVGPAEQVGDVLDLGALGVEGEDVDRAGAVAGAGGHR